MHEFLEFLKNNQFASGGLLIGFLAFLYRYGMYVLDFITSYIKKQFLVTFTVSSFEAPQPYLKLLSWCKEELIKNNKNLYYQSITATEKNIAEGRYLLKTSLGYVFISFHTVEGKGDTGNGFIKRYSITVTLLSRNKEKFINHLEAITDNNVYKLIYSVQKDYYNVLGTFDLSYITEKTLIMDPAIFNSVIDDLKTYYSSKQKYDDLGIPYKRIILLNGPPGNGKTSFIKYLSNYFKKSICITSLEDIEVESISDVLVATKSQVIFVVEDFDRTDMTKQIQTLLNLFDGITTPNNFVAILTCNDISKIDPALARPGRIDRIFNIKNANKDQAKRIFLKFHPTRNDLAQTIFEQYVEGSKSAAKVQELSLINTPEEAAKAIIKNEN